MKIKNVEKPARLARALKDWDAFEKSLRRKDRERGLSIDAGYIEDDHGELVQPDHSIVVGVDTGRAILAAAKKIIEDEARKLGLVIVG